MVGRLESGAPMGRLVADGQVARSAIKGSAFVSALPRKGLRQRGLTYAHVAGALGLAESSVKRLFA
jgi:hypothetical protein